MGSKPEGGLERVVLKLGSWQGTILFLTLLALVLACVRLYADVSSLAGTLTSTPPQLKVEGTTPGRGKTVPDAVATKESDSSEVSTEEHTAAMAQEGPDATESTPSNADVDTHVDTEHDTSSKTAGATALIDASVSELDIHAAPTVDLRSDGRPDSGQQEAVGQPDGWRPTDKVERYLACAALTTTTNYMANEILDKTVQEPSGITQETREAANWLSYVLLLRMKESGVNVAKCKGSRQWKYFDVEACRSEIDKKQPLHLSKTLCSESVSAVADKIINLPGFPKLSVSLAYWSRTHRDRTECYCGEAP